MYKIISYTDARNFLSNEAKPFFDSLPNTDKIYYNDVFVDVEYTGANGTIQIVLMNDGYYLNTIRPNSHTILFYNYSYPLDIETIILDLTQE